MKSIELKIEEIKDDRKERWNRQESFCHARQNFYDKNETERKIKNEKQEKMLTNILREVGRINGSIDVVKTHIEYLKEKTN